MDTEQSGIFGNEIRSFCLIPAMEIPYTLYENRAPLDTATVKFGQGKAHGQAAYTNNRYPRVKMSASIMPSNITVRKERGSNLSTIFLYFLELLWWASWWLSVWLKPEEKWEEKKANKIK